MPNYWTRKDDHTEEVKTITPWEQTIDGGDKIFPDPKTQGYLQRIKPGQVKRYVQMMELPSDEAAIREYRKWHSREHMWRDIVAGIRQAGLLEMEIYILGNRLVMIVDAPAWMDWQEAMRLLSTLPRQAEWEAFVSRFQGCSAEARSSEKWQMMERMFHLYDYEQDNPPA